jgi:hypothetical protein
MPQNAAIRFAQSISLDGSIGFATVMANALSPKAFVQA